MKAQRQFGRGTMCEPRDALIGQRVTKYRIVHKLSRGGMGVVYKAEDTRLGRHVALKLLPRERCGGSSTRDGLRGEACAASSVGHPNICAVYGAGQHNGRLFIVRELIEGKGLQEYLQSEPLSLDQLLDLGIQCAAALEAAHDSGIVHGSITPANIYITDHKQAKVLDFGTAGGSEQVSGPAVDGSSDVRSLAAVLHDAATRSGLLPLDVAATPAADCDPPAKLAAVLSRALQQHGEHYRNAAKLRAALQSIRRKSDSTSIPADSRVSPSRRRVFRRSRTRAAYGIVGLACVLLLVMMLGWNKYRHENSAVSSADTVAVLPFRNLGPSVDNSQRFALAKDIVSVLATNSPWKVRDVSQVQRYAGAFDAQQAGRELGVSKLVTGHYARRGEQLKVTIEVIETAENRLEWLGSVTVPAQDVSGLQRAIQQQLGGSFLPLHPDTRILDRTTQASRRIHTVF
ncbi:MAG: protein kinase [Terriglobales bacterium]